MTLERSNWKSNLFWIAIYAIAMALLEAVAVAYIRGLGRLSHSGVDVSAYFRLELWREAATLVMLLAVAWAVGRRWPDRLAYGLFAFGLWDIWYYIWLRLFIDWPASLLDWDTLFLLPFRWSGPVLSPVLIAGLMCITAVTILSQQARGKRPSITLSRLITLVIGAVLALYTFMQAPIHAWLWAYVEPIQFPWSLFLLALTLMTIPSLSMSWPGHRP